MLNITNEELSNILEQQKVKKKMGKDLNRHLYKEDIQKAQRYERMFNVTSHQRYGN